MKGGEVMNDQNNPQSNDQDQIPPETYAFLESLLSEVHMEYVDPQQKEEMLMQLYARLDYFLTAKIIDAIPDADLEAFTQMNEQGKSREEVEAFIMEKVPQAQELFKNAFLEFRELYVGAGRQMEEEEQSSGESTSLAPVPPAPVENTQTASPVVPTQELSEDVPPPPPAPIAVQSSDEETNGSGPMVN
jgi:hypothetical protein